MPKTFVDWLALGLAVLTAAAVAFALWEVIFGPRALSLLVFRYLRKRRIAWVSLVAVTLCTMMVIVVISVMGGWLRMFRQTNHGLIGDISIYRGGLDGFAHYDEMIAGIEALKDEQGKPVVKAAAPQVRSFGLIKFYHQFGDGVEVVGVDIKEIQKVNGFADSLHLKPDVLNTMAEKRGKEAAELLEPPADAQVVVRATLVAIKLVKSMHFNSDIENQIIAEIEIQGSDMVNRGDATAIARAAQLNADAMAMRKKALEFPSFDNVYSEKTYHDELPKAPKDKKLSELPGIIVGVGVAGLHKDKNGVIDHPEYIYDQLARLTVLVNTDDVSADAGNFVSTQDYWICDDSRTNFFQVDERSVYVSFDRLQKDLKMNSVQIGVDPKTGQPVMSDARCNEINIALNNPAQIDKYRPEIERVAREVIEKYDMNFLMNPIMVQTWEERQAEFLHAVEHEEGLLVILFAIISVVAVFLIFCIFFMIVMEKTRDIGIIKSVGVTSSGIAGIFLGYGLAIGIIGGGMGIFGGWLIIHNINEIHAWLGEKTGLVIWDPRTYLFDTIPNTVDPKTVLIIASIAVIASVVGALIPAIRAARMNPIEALRWE